MVETSITSFCLDATTSASVPPRTTRKAGPPHGGVAVP